MVAGSLPAGLGIATNGAITGTPTVAGTSDFTVQVTSGDAQTAQRATSITVTDCYIIDCDDLQGWWKLDESPAANGSSIADASGQGHVGTLVTDDGATDKSILGQVGNALDLDGTGDHVTIPDAPGLDFAGDFTFMIWINPDLLPADEWKALISNYDADSQARVRGASLWLKGGTVQVWFSPPSNEPQAESTGTVTTGSWQHVAATFDGTADEIRIYIDGALDGTTLSVTATPQTNNEPLFLRQRGDDQPQHYFDGALDEVMVWSRVLGAQEIQDIYDCTR